MLRESKGNMYTWVTHEWNPVKGECFHNCSYCYMKRWGKQNPIRLSSAEFKDDLGSGNTIFVVSGSDLFAQDVPDEWIRKTLEYCREFDNTYLFQTKNPGNVEQWIDLGFIPEKSIFCTMIETNRWYGEHMGNCPLPKTRAMDINDVAHLGFKTYVTIEPIMKFDLDEMLYLIETCLPEQVNIGADSGNNHLPEPTKDEVLALIDGIKQFAVIDQKRNLSRLLV